jgi:ABC-type multidrug transport system ATPase subunit
MMNVITKLFPDISSAVVFCQLALVILTIFGGGLFIRWVDTPAYWVWLQTISIFTHSTRMAMQNVMRKITYNCKLMGGVCYGSYGEVYDCEGSVDPSDKECDVNGSSVLYVTQEVGFDENYWNSYGYLVALLVAFELLVLVLMYYPIERISYRIHTAFFPTQVLSKIASSESRIRSLQGRVQYLVNKDLGLITTPNMSAMDCKDDEHDPLLGGQPPKKLTLSWRNITLKLKSNGNTLVDNVSGRIEQGKCLALMGPSGAGKTTLLNALAGRAPYANVTGDVMFGSTPMLPSDLMFVPQYDELKGYATVLQQIEYVGRMKCKDVGEMKVRLLKLLKILGLFSKAHTLCKDLSGGEQKRLSVGMGMISNPNILFLDEPTSGLDSTAAFYIVKYLVCLAKTTNVAVIMTIHQPAAIVFDMLQDLYLLETGRLAYFGPISAAKGYFASLGMICPAGINPADFYLQLIYKAPPDQAEGVLWRDLFAKTPLGQQQMAPCIECDRQLREAPNEPPTQMARLISTILFFLKYFSQHPGYYIMRVGYLIMAAVFVGTMYLDLHANTASLVEYSGAVSSSSDTCDYLQYCHHNVLYITSTLQQLICYLSCVLCAV